MEGKDRQEVTRKIPNMIPKPLHPTFYTPTDKGF